MEKFKHDGALNLGRLEGLYRLEIHHEDGSVTDTGFFKNLILNTGLDAMGWAYASPSDGRQGLYNACVVGTGTTPPAPTQNSLVSQLAGTNVVSFTQLTNSGSPNYVKTVQYQYRFNTGAVVGNISEVGVGNQISQVGQALWSRALILDGSGSPTTITILSTDQLYVYYQLNMYPRLTDQTGTFTIGTTTYTYTMRPASAQSNPSGYYPLNGGTGAIGNSTLYLYPTGTTLGPVTGSLSGGNIYGKAISPSSTYTNGTYNLNFSATISPTEANGGIGGAMFYIGTYSEAQYQMVFSPIIPKTSLQSLTLNFNVNWSQ